VLWCNTAVLAYTSIPAQSRKVTVKPVAAELRQIQICPWLLNYAMAAAEFGTTTRIGDSFWNKWRQRSIPKIANKFYTPIDMVSLFDRILLHEV